MFSPFQNGGTKSIINMLSSDIITAINKIMLKTPSKISGNGCQSIQQMKKHLSKQNYLITEQWESMVVKPQPTPQLSSL